MEWADDRAAYLRELFATNRFSASDMAAKINVRFDCDLTRNAVIGKLSRLGLVNQRYLPRFGNRVVKPKKNSIRPFNMGGAPTASAKSVMTPEPKAAAFTGDPAEIPLEQRRTLLELNDHTCRYPYGDPHTPEFFFCGSPTASLHDRRSYCARHAALVYHYPKPVSDQEQARRQQHGQWLSRVAARKRAAA